MIYTGQELFLKQLNEPAISDLITSSNIQRCKPMVNFKDLESFIGLNESLQDRCDPISVFYEPYSEKHLSFSFPIPYCSIQDSIKVKKITNVNVSTINLNASNETTNDPKKTRKNLNMKNPLPPNSNSITFTTRVLSRNLLPQTQ
ncbi:predicted protein [Naegleria gruberi]|uniref:Predicted protein n=1 Tax=Naegleria gruberi TaxID=5762 RepID=D2UXY1_NAEGR|nr:uncharacterized protein NAEGRDRAFT_61278 [Naegleria gruberi]EFC50371.1 predicted protein [Naegleria gruberi]|eukprot:XP_002683115.1 predicted protein [Naegleria gruberi strain NEG-M]